MLRLLPIFALLAFAVPVRAVGDSGHIVYAKATIVADLADADADGLADVTERQLGTDPANADTDGDGLTDGDEEILVNTSALVADTDGDGFGDGIEVAAGSGPTAASSFPVTVAGTVSNAVTVLSGPLVCRLVPSDPERYECVTNNAAAGRVNREFVASGDFAPFAFTNAAACNVAFRIEAWADANGNGERDEWEPQGDCEFADGVPASVSDVAVRLTVDAMVGADCLIVFDADDGLGTISPLLCRPGGVCKLPKNTMMPPVGRAHFAGWRCSNGRRYDDEMLVFNLAKPGEVIKMTAIWE